MINNNIRPDFLRQGDKAIIISPSGNIEPELIDKAVTRLQSWGLNVEVSPHAKNQHGRFCGTIEERLSDIQNAFDDEKAKLILCSRGGYGCVHLLEKLNFEKIKKTPKWLVGYSDITVLHQAFLLNNMASLHAPMAKHIVEEDSNNISTQYLKELLFGNIAEYKIDTHPLNTEGCTKGILFGGNLAVLCSLIGSEYLQIPENGILFIEDIGEDPYKIDRMMWTLKLSGILAKIKGLIIGSFSGYEEDPLMYENVYESIRTMIEPFDIPICFNFPVGHTKHNYPLLHGCAIELNIKNNNSLFKPIII